MKKSDRYLKLVEWSEEDHCYIGTCPTLFGGGCHGDDEAKVYKKLCALVDEWVVIYEKDGMPLPKGMAGKEYSGKFNVRLGKGLHKVLAVKATQHGESLNTYCKNLLSEAVKKR